MSVVTLCALVVGSVRLSPIPTRASAPTTHRITCCAARDDNDSAPDGGGAWTIGDLLATIATRQTRALSGPELASLDEAALDAILDSASSTLANAFDDLSDDLAALERNVSSSLKSGLELQERQSASRLANVTRSLRRSMILPGRRAVRRELALVRQVEEERARVRAEPYIEENPDAALSCLRACAPRVLPPPASPRRPSHVCACSPACAGRDNLSQRKAAADAQIMPRRGRDAWWEERLASGGGASRTLELSASALGLLLLLAAGNLLLETLLHPAIDSDSADDGRWRGVATTAWRFGFAGAFISYLGALAALTQQPSLRLRREDSERGGGDGT